MLQDEDKGRLLEYSCKVGILEGKIIANSEENKALRQRLQALEEKAHETEVAIRQCLDEEKALRAKNQLAQAEATRVKEEVEGKFKAAAAELDAQEREMQAREADMLEAEGPIKPRCGCRVQ